MAVTDQQLKDLRVAVLTKQKELATAQYEFQQATVQKQIDDVSGAQ